MNVSKRDYFASQAMLAVITETQEMRVASFWDWIKHLLVTYLQLTFLSVKYKQVEGSYEKAAKRAFEYADAMLKESERTDTKLFDLARWQDLKPESSVNS